MMIKNFKLEQRLDYLRSTWPNTVADEFNKYYSKAKWNKGFINNKNNGLKSIPFWFELPCHLLEHYNYTINEDKEINDFLSDCLWAQYCVYLFVRIKDDILDLHYENRFISLIADQFLIESEKSFAQHLSRSSNFWEIFHQMLRETTLGAFQKEYFQKDKNNELADVLEFSGKEAGILTLGSAAICCKLNRESDFGKLKDFIFNLVIALQILDDFSDIEEDIERGNYNYFVKKLLSEKKIKTNSNREIMNGIISSLLFSNGFNSITKDIEIYIKRSEASLDIFNIPYLNNLISNYRKEVFSMRKEFHKIQIKYFFGEKYIKLF